MPEKPTDFVDGLVTMAGQGLPHAQIGAAAHVYAANQSMTRRAFYNADGEMLIVRSKGASASGPSSVSRGYVCENYGANFRFPTSVRSGRTGWPILVTS